VEKDKGRSRKGGIFDGKQKGKVERKGGLLSLEGRVGDTGRGVEVLPAERGCGVSAKAAIHGEKKLYLTKGEAFMRRSGSTSRTEGATRWCEERRLDLKPGVWGGKKKNYKKMGMLDGRRDAPR